MLLLSVRNLDLPEVPAEQQIEQQTLGAGFQRVQLRYGFMQRPDVPAALARCAAHGLAIDAIDLDEVTHYIGRETLVIADRSALLRLRKRLFAFISRNAPPATAYFKLPPSRVVELGMQIEL